MNNDEENIRQLCNKSIQLFNDGDYDGLAKLYTENTQFLAPDFSRINSNEGVRNFWKTAFNAGYRFKSVDTIELKVSDHLAYWLFSWIMTNPEADGSTKTNTGKNVLIWENTPSGWLICLDSWNSPA